MRIKSITLLFATTLCAKAFAQYGHFQSSEYQYPADPLVREKLDQWQDLKFGMIIHWGIYAVPGIVESCSICSEDWIGCDSTSCNICNESGVDRQRTGKRLKNYFAAHWKAGQLEEGGQQNRHRPAQRFAGGFTGISI